jgi:hypothetical protein
MRGKILEKKEVKVKRIAHIADVHIRNVHRIA